MTSVYRACTAYANRTCHNSCNVFGNIFSLCLMYTAIVISRNIKGPCITIKNNTLYYSRKDRYIICHYSFHVRRRKRNRHYFINKFHRFTRECRIGIFFKRKFKSCSRIIFSRNRKQALNKIRFIQSVNNNGSRNESGNSRIKNFNSYIRIFNSKRNFFSIFKLKIFCVSSLYSKTYFTGICISCRLDICNCYRKINNTTIKIIAINGIDRCYIASCIFCGTGNNFTSVRSGKLTQPLIDVNRWESWYAEIYKSDMCRIR